MNIKKIAAFLLYFEKHFVPIGFVSALCSVQSTTVAVEAIPNIFISLI